VIARDLTQRKELEAAINQSKRLDAIGQLAAGIAHEINTPIQFVGDNANFLRQSFDETLPLVHCVISSARAASGTPRRAIPAAVRRRGSATASLDPDPTPCRREDRRRR
jgi:two-component system, NtrC family, sensor kinase